MANFVEPVDILMVGAANGLDMEVEQVVQETLEGMVKKMKVVFPKAEEELVDFLNYGKLNNSKFMLCPRCSAVFDKKVAKEVKTTKPSDPKRSNKGGLT